MTKASRLSVIGVLSIGVLCLPARVSAQQLPAIADQIAKTHGLDSFGQVDRIREMEFHHGGSAKPSVVIATWADYKKAGPLLLSLDHRGTADGKPFRLFFSKVAVKLAGSSTWVDAQ